MFYCEQRPVSLSWLVVSVRDVKVDYDWFWDKQHHCCYGVPVEELKESIPKSIAEHYKKCGNNEEYYTNCVRLPDYPGTGFLDTAIYIKEWCEENGVLFNDDLENYKKVEASYWGYDFYDGYEPMYRITSWKANNSISVL